MCRYALNNSEVFSLLNKYDAMELGKFASDKEGNSNTKRVLLFWPTSMFLCEDIFCS